MEPKKSLLGNDFFGVDIFLVYRALDPIIKSKVGQFITF